MNRLTLTFLLTIAVSFFSYSQTTTVDYLNVKSGNGKGLRFWNGSNSYRIAMGNATEYKYGPVTDYSIKSFMSSTSGRGWTWGVSGQVPIAALRNDGTFQIAKNFTSLGNIYGNRFYDRNNTGYYLDPASTSIVNNIRASRFYDRNNTGYYLDPASTSKLNIVNQNKLGINVPTPGKEIHLYKHIDGVGSFPAIRFENSWSAFPNVYWISEIHGGQGGISFRFGETNSKHADPGNLASVIQFHSNGMDLDGGSGFRIRQNSGGSHFIYLDSKNEAITINGKDFKIKPNGYVYARQVEVIGSGTFPDYVFDEDYDLRSLEEVENYIEENHHLPEVPSAQEIQDNGHNLGQMDEILLKKVEELTLYMIELKKENEELKDRIKVLEDEK